MQRPTGVTVIAVLGFIFGALAVLEGLWTWFAIAKYLAMAQRSTVTVVGMNGAFAGIVLMAIAALVIVTSVGLLKLQDWARVLMIVLNAVHLVVAALGLMEAFRHIRTPFFFGMMLRHIVMIAIGVWIIVYLVQPHVKQAFRPAAPAAT